MHLIWKCNVFLPETGVHANLLLLNAAGLLDTAVKGKGNYLHIVFQHFSLAQQ